MEEMYTWTLFLKWDDVMWFLNHECKTDLAHTKIVPCHTGGYYVVY